MDDRVDPRPPLDQARLSDVATFLIEVVPEAESTQLLAGDRARAGAADFTTVVAEHQTSGRGRLDRSWESPARAGLTFSVVLRPAMPPGAWPWIPLLAGLAVCAALRETGVQPSLKWPNDVLVGVRKLAGILVERVETQQGPAAIVGVGINVSTTAAELPIQRATSLAHCGFAVDRTDLLLATLREVQRTYAAWQAPGGQAALLTSYAAACGTAHDQAVRVELPGGAVLDGIGVGIEPGGGLIVRTATGETTVNAGDVVHVRSAG
jgi:BirA family biotin operon repressor/biotin-[acetyl-CoA-carboxylase] ligase